MGLRTHRPSTQKYPVSPGPQCPSTQMKPGPGATPTISTRGGGGGPGIDTPIPTPTRLGGTQPIVIIINATTATQSVPRRTPILVMIRPSMRSRRGADLA